MTDIRLNMAWEELFGKTIDEMPMSVKIERWDAWKSLAIAAGIPQSEIDTYESGELCQTCKFQDSGWCKLLHVPSGYDYIRRMSGQACQGQGFKQIKSIHKLC